MNNYQRVAVAGSAANPPHLGHRLFVEALIGSGLFDVVFWIVSGNHPLKNELATCEFRVLLTRLLFNKRWRKKFWKIPLKIIFDDSSKANTPTIVWMERFISKYQGAEIFLCSGSDIFYRRKEYGELSEMEACWEGGARLFSEFRHCVLFRAGYSDRVSIAIPPKGVLLFGKGIPEISSTEIRRRIRVGGSLSEFLLPEMEEVIRSNKLFGFGFPAHE